MEDLLGLLRVALGNPAAQFKEGQEEAIRSVLHPPRRSLVVEATGWGKSMVYFLATRILRSRGMGPTLVVSPLLALMRDQLRAADRLGLRAAQYSSANQDEWEEIERRLRLGQLDLLLVSPERLANETFQRFLGSTSLSRVGLLVIDEAHCISDWGHDFRPDYQRLGRLVRALPPTTAVLATTATANTRVVEDIRSQLGPNISVQRGSLARESLRLQVIEGMTMAERYAWISDHLNELPGSGIIYVLTTSEADRLSDWLQVRGHQVLPYHASLSGDKAECQRLRQEREDALRRDEVKGLVATVALGMGFDKPNLGYVIHHQSPGNLVSYYQQIGRAGRALDDAVAILFLGGEDDSIIEFFLENARPPEEDIEAVLTTLSNSPLSTRELELALNLTVSQLSQILKLLSVVSPSPVTKSNKKWQLTPETYQPDLQAEAQRRANLLAERRRLVAFAQGAECLMMAVRRDLDDPDASPCGRCAVCTGQAIVSRTYLASTLQAASAFLKQSEFYIHPRKRWTFNGMPEYGFKGNIAPDLQCVDGLCLSRWGETGTGAMVREDKLKGYFRDELVQLATEAINRKNWQVFPKWVTAVPSSRSKALVPSFAERLAQSLGLPFVVSINKIRSTEPQKDQRNSAHQTANLDGAFEVVEVLPGPVLLVDDMVDSRWTFTIVGALLRMAGTAAVIPFALASTANQRDDEGS